MQSIGTLPAESFFLDTSSGYRFCLYFPPAAGTRCLGGIVYIAPFAEEMNKARKMAAMQARRLAVNGYGVLLIDLLGCGDSSGELKDADWSNWKQDIQDAIKLMRDKINAPVSLWGLRLGALLALDLARYPEYVFEKIVLWQPILQGASFMNQFFRLRLANDMLNQTTNSNQLQPARTLLSQGHTVEIAGYGITPRLTASIDALDASDWQFGTNVLHWLECVPDQVVGFPPARQKIIERWKENGVQITAQTIAGVQFWMTQETSVNADLVNATAHIFPPTSI
ncbi:hydrolase 2, exosortase A system-associated [Undibacterium sp. Jales W-56]|uniref:hydrolase 2, exosortase A system-associated n=1 Tax=Undibacterium sp. Jales W-56 TaxID=2897325 RepID=UPI0021CEA698|nr:hydrolase 2, exosortase A system-associated [Undibacterium sp. Jales W-56]MCU6434152.1 hydrolase 2, exosortase A system-associated [Undibacterium sp. Jales W-56]